MTYGQIQRAIVNQSLEQPALALSSNSRVDENFSEGWNTTHPIAGSCNIGATPCRPFEFWTSGFLSVFTAPGAGTQWVELNADTNSMIYQSVCLINGESFDYSFLHSGRGSTTVPDVMQFRIGIPSGLPAGSKPNDSYGFTIMQTSTTSDGTVTTAPTGSGIINSPVGAGNGWVRYSGTYTYTGATQVVNIGYSAVSSSGGISFGNFIDDWQINLNPFMEVSATSVSNPEGTILGGGSNTPNNRPAIRIGGTLTSPATVTVQVSGGTATIGNDYSLSSPFALNNTTDSVQIIIPAGVYDGVSAESVFLLPFSVSTDNTPEPDETVLFNVSGVTGATQASLTTCGSIPTATQTYTIANDDILTSAPASISGKVVKNGRGLANVRLILIGENGEIYLRTTNNFGYFNFREIASGVTYILQANHKTAQFTPHILNLTDNLDGLLIEAQ